MKALRFWIEIAKHMLNVWDTVSTDLGYSPFTNGKKNAQTQPKAEK